MLKKLCNTFSSIVIFAKQCWRFINLDIPPNGSFSEITSYFKDKRQSQFFMVAVALLCWVIWLARKDLIFKRVQPSIVLADASSSRKFCWSPTKSSQDFRCPLINGHKLWCKCVISRLLLIFFVSFFLHLLLVRASPPCFLFFISYNNLYEISQKQL